MPGVVVTQGVRPGAGGGLGPPAAQLFLAGLTERGRTDVPVIAGSMAEFERLLGPRVTYGALHDQARAYFEEAGESSARVVAARVVGAGASIGTLTRSDRAGSPLPTIRVDAVSPGAWSSGVTVEVVDGTLPNTFSLLVRLGGELIESFRNLTSPADAQTQSARSDLIRVVNLGSVTAAPGNNPSVQAPAALTAGTDDRASVTGSTYTAALARFGPELGAGAVAIPGQPHSTVGSALVTHARANRRVALVATVAGATSSDAITAASSLTSSNGRVAGLFWPWVQVPGPAGGSVTISPEGYVAGVRARAITQEGPWRAPAGSIAVAGYVTGLERETDTATGETLNAARVNVIRRVGGNIQLYGYRSLDADEVNWRLLKYADTVNVIDAEAERVAQPAVFGTVDGQGRAAALLGALLKGIVAPIADAGGLFARVAPDGTVVDPGYSIDTGASVNTPQTLALDELRAVLNVRVSPSAETVRITINKAATDAAVA